MRVLIGSLISVLALSFTAGAESGRTVVIIGSPTSARWKVPRVESARVMEVDRDVEPHLAAAYAGFAAIMGETADPTCVVVTAHFEPVAAAPCSEIGAKLSADASAAALAVRRYFLAGHVRPGISREPQFDPIGGGVFTSSQSFDKRLADQVTFLRSATNREARRQTLEYLLVELQQDNAGGFVAGQAAESLVPGKAGPVLVEGGYYRWDRAELRRIVGDRGADIVSFHYGLPYLRTPRDEAETRARFGFGSDELRLLLETARTKLRDARLKRPEPKWNTALITEYNADAISALVRGYFEFEDVRYRDAARRALTAVLQKNDRAGKLMRAGSVEALPQDYAALVRALVDLYAATRDLGLLDRAVEMQRRADAALSPTVPAPLAALAPAVEIPNGHLAALALLTGDEGWTRRAGAELAKHRQVLIAGSADVFLDVARGEMVFLLNSERARRKIAAWMPYAKDVAPVEKQGVATVCVQRTCRTPTTDPAVLAAWLSERQ